MEETLNKILLKPRFKINLKQDADFILTIILESLKNNKIKYPFKMANHHIFIDVAESNRKIWSPQLELILEKNEKGCELKGLFSPKPAIWTFFIFLHFVTAISFFIFFALAYANIVAKNNTKTWLYLMGVTVFLWILLYFLGQLGKHKAKEQIEELKSFLKKSLENLF